MQLYLKSKRNCFEAIGEFDVENRKFTVLKGSRVSSSVKNFRGAKPVQVLRTKYVKDGKTIRNVDFHSPSTAANFVTGTSANGLRVWKNNKGDILREILKL